MVDFTKLRDPEFKAKFKAKREAEDARQEALDKEVLEKLSVLEAHIESLSGGILPDLKDGASTLQSRRLSGVEPENLPCRSIPLVNGGVFTQTALIDKERSFFRSVRQRHLMWLDLSGPQKKWLDDIAARLLSPDDAGAARPRALGDQFRPD